MALLEKAWHPSFGVPGDRNEADILAVAAATI